MLFHYPVLMIVLGVTEGGFLLPEFLPSLAVDVRRHGIAPVFSCVARTSAQRGLFLPRRTHTRCRGRKPHTAATRASRRGAGALLADRVDRVDFSHGGKIGTFGTPERDQPLSVAAVDLDQNPVFP